MNDLFDAPEISTAESALDAGRFWEALRAQDVMALEEMLCAQAARLLALRDPQTGRSPLQWCCFLRRHDSMRALLAWGADPDAAPDGRPTPMSLAVGARDQEAVAILAEAGADPNLANPDGWRTPLIEAAILPLASHSARMVKAALDAGADPNAITPQGLFALGASAQANRAADIETLLEAGAELETHAGDGYTALFFAVESGSVDAAAALLKAGADFSAKCQDNGAARGLAECVGDDSGMKGLLYAFAEAGVLRAKIMARPAAASRQAIARL